jgi:hypothetical protein
MGSGRYAIQHQAERSLLLAEEAEACQRGSCNLKPWTNPPAHHDVKSFDIGELERPRVRLGPAPVHGLKIGPLDKHFTASADEVVFPADRALLPTIAPLGQKFVLDDNSVFFPVASGHRKSNARVGRQV